ncbi:RNA helicase Mov10l1 [Chanos chanos]|uniref:RNA helicase n=1 Tax=Chanos chanos TaxID=29144 RepID=A0A6J2VFJ6_CHACN|nr:RNA helicase Mov10l1 [Chanos chanos]
MVTVVQFVISKLFSPLWRRAVDDYDEYIGYNYGAEEEVKQVHGGLVSQLCQDYGLINDSIYFTFGEVLGGVPLCVGDTVHATVVRDGAHGGWKALRVEKQADAWEDGGGVSLESETSRLRPLIGTVTSFNKDGGFINQNTFFSHSALCEGFEPMKGDWVQAQYFISPTQWSSQASHVVPLRYRRLDKVRVSSVFGSNGVVEDSVFFSLDSLLLPAQYRPLPGDLVNVVMVESSQSFYCWRALCMAPSQPSLSVDAGVGMSENKVQTLLDNKAGVVVSENTHFGSLFLGEHKELQIWIENQGLERQTLKCYEFAGWDTERQFSLAHVADTVTHTPDLSKQQPAITQLLVDGTVELETDGIPETAKKTSVIRMVQRDLEIVPGGKTSVAVSCQAKSMGRSTELLLLHFSSFTIGRRLDVAVNSREERHLQPSAPYCPASPLPPPQPQPKQVVTVMAPPPSRRLSRRHLPNFLGPYPVPQALRECVETGGDVLVAQPALGETLSLANMLPRFSMLLWLEELQAEMELKEFTISGALLRKGATHLHLEVPGLAEGRPSLYAGDKVLLKKPSNRGVVIEYIGYVAEITEEDVSLRVNTEFQQSYLGEPLDVEFTLNRLTVRRCHSALEQSKHFGENVLFPSSLVLQSPQWVGEWGPEDLVEGEKKCQATDKPSALSMDMVSVATQTKTRNILEDSRMGPSVVPRPGQFFSDHLNPAQKRAVMHILSGECRPTPYILFGPPGTGKTVTLIEAILQVYHRLPSSRILVCTPSNSAADLICIRLHECGYLHTASLARVNATCRPEESIPGLLQQYSRAGEDIRHASFHRIVVSTCSSAGMFYQIGLQAGHFTHVFLDEAGQATEPECLIPLGLLCERDGQIVLAGDPQQLGPVVKSTVARAFGLGVSLLERLMALPLYSCEDKGYNPLLVTKLVYNYRSHEALLALPSQLFYAGDLCVRAQRVVVDSFCHWNQLPTKGFPLIFHGVRGTELREGNNPSWFNPGEAVQVMLYCCRLSKRLYNPVLACDIGIIAPYRKQAEKIRVLLQRVGLADIKVGSVEEFQGQEFLVIILSTVRSNEDALSDDLQSVLGFISNPKRFNVAITRPKALLIIIGNPHVLIKDPCFRALLQYCYENGAFIGCDPPVSLRASHRTGSQK